MNASTNGDEMPLYCQSHLTRQPHINSTGAYALYMTNALVNAVFSIVAVFGNALVMLSLRKVTHLGAPTKALLVSLALSDFGVGVTVQPVFVIHITSARPAVQCTAGIVFDLLSGHFSVVTLLTMTAISIDKYLAIRLRLRYRAVVTFRRVAVVLAMIRGLAILWAATWLWKPYVYLMFVTTMIPLCIIVTTLAFVKIRLILLKQENQLRKSSAVSLGRVAQFSVAKNNFLAVSSYRRSVVTLFLIYCALLVCYIPAWVVTALGTFGSVQSSAGVTQLSLTLVFLNSSVNPLLYLWRMSEVRHAAWEMLAAAKCCCTKIASTQQENDERNADGELQA